jgi:hypothetical protein
MLRKYHYHGVIYIAPRTIQKLIIARNNYLLEIEFSAHTITSTQMNTQRWGGRRIFFVSLSLLYLYNGENDLLFIDKED